jgi:hypothetical protein
MSHRSPIKFDTIRRGKVIRLVRVRQRSAPPPPTLAEAIQYISLEKQQLNPEQAAWLVFGAVSGRREITAEFVREFEEWCQSTFLDLTIEAVLGFAESELDYQATEPFFRMTAEERKILSKRENRLRKMAQRRGLWLRKSRENPVRMAKLGFEWPYMLVRESTVVKSSGDIGQIERYLRTAEAADVRATRCTTR